MKRCFAIIVAVVVFDLYGDVGIFLIFLIRQCFCLSRCCTLCTRRRPRKRSDKTVSVPGDHEVLKDDYDYAGNDGDEGGEGVGDNEDNVEVV